MSETRPDDNTRYRSINPPGNSKKAKEEAEYDKQKRPEVEQVTKARATTRKKGLGSRIKESFTGDDAQTVGGYILFDVILPAFQNLVVDAFQQGVERMILGDSRPNYRRRQSERRGYTSYNRVYGGGGGYRDPETRPPGHGRDLSDRARASHDFDQIVLDNRGEAEYVLECMGDLLDRYDQVTVADLYRLVGLRASSVDYRWGWTRLHHAEVRRSRDGYLLELPTPEDLDKR